MAAGRGRDVGRPGASVCRVPPTRYRCTACGNLTRFDVVTDRRTRAFHHYSVGGELVLEDEQVLGEEVVEVSCRWCGHGRAVEALAAPTMEGGDQRPTSQPPVRLSEKTIDGDPPSG
jgi:hypothetical protein